MRGATVSTQADISRANLFQSTHPVRGATMSVLAFHRTEQFQSTHPVRGATPKDVAMMMALLFQSTHPVRGATRGRGSLHVQCRYFNPRTPCGVRPPGPGTGAAPLHFNPRTPCGVRRSRHAVVRAYPRISIHAPRAGCDLAVIKPQCLATILIHAPRAGCDIAAILFLTTMTNFNPRTPCGVRPCSRRANAF